MNKVLVGCPTSFHKEYCLAEYANAVKGLSYKNKDILLVDNSPDDEYIKKIKSLGLQAIKGPFFEGARDRIIASRNVLRKKVLDEGYEYFLSLEQDVIPPADIIERLMGHDKKIITGIYFVRNVFPGGITALVPLAYKLTDKKTLTMEPLSDEEWQSGKLMNIVSCGLGCVMIHRDVLKDISFRYEKEKDSFDDRWFCIDAYKKGIEMYADTSVRCRHRIFNRPYEWRNIKK